MTFLAPKIETYNRLVLANDRDATATMAARFGYTVVRTQPADSENPPESYWMTCVKVCAVVREVKEKSYLDKVLEAPQYPVNSDGWGYIPGQYETGSANINE